MCTVPHSSPDEIILKAISVCLYIGGTCMLHVSRPAYSMRMTIMSIFLSWGHKFYPGCQRQYLVIHVFKLKHSYIKINCESCCCLMLCQFFNLPFNKPCSHQTLFQIHNEEIHDLLNPGTPDDKIAIRETLDGGIKVSYTVTTLCFINCQFEIF